jgi:hypothetical protein
MSDSNVTTRKRPFVRLQTWQWRDADGTTTAGVGIFRGNELKAHLTSVEARKMADQLHDIADRLEASRETEKDPNGKTKA